MQNWRIAERRQFETLEHFRKIGGIPYKKADEYCSKFTIRFFERYATQEAIAIFEDLIAVTAA